MLQLNIKELREQLAEYIARVESGEEIIVTRCGKGVAHLAPPDRMRSHFPDLTDFRTAIALSGEGVSITVIFERR